jgi:hypothetical protein
VHILFVVSNIYPPIKIAAMSTFAPPECVHDVPERIHADLTGLTSSSRFVRVGGGGDGLGSLERRIGRTEWRGWIFDVWRADR